MTQYGERLHLVNDRTYRNDDWLLFTAGNVLVCRVGDALAASRLAACYNSLLGIPDEALEKVREWLALKRVKDIAGDAFYEGDYTNEKSDTWHAARMALEKAENELGQLLAEVRT